MRQWLVALLSRGWSTDPAPASRRGRLALGVVSPDDVAVVVGRRDADKAVPDLGPPKLLLRGLARDLALEHDVAVIRRADNAPAVLGEQVDQPRDLGQALRLLGDVLAEPGRVGALAAILTIELVADRAEDMDEDVVRTGHGRSLG